MKTFIALICIGILTYTYAAYIYIRRCENPTPMEGFNATRFFTNAWYVTHVKNITTRQVCRTFITTQEDDKLIVNYGFHNGARENYYKCEAVRNANIGTLTFDCKRDNNPVQENWIVMGTDYEDYAVLYRCKSTESGLRYDNYLIIKRICGNETLSEETKSLTDNLKLQKCSIIKRSATS